MLPVSTVAVQNAVPMPQIGVVTGMVNFFRSLGGAVLTACFGAIVVGASGVEGGRLMEQMLVAGTDPFRWRMRSAGCL